MLAAAAAYRRMLAGASNNYTGFDPAAAARDSPLPWLPWRPEVHRGLPPVDRLAELIRRREPAVFSLVGSGAGT